MDLDFCILDALFSSYPIVSLVSTHNKLQTPWKARTPAPTLERFEAGLGLDENLRLEMSLKRNGTIVDR